MPNQNPNLEFDFNFDSLAVEMLAKNFLVNFTPEELYELFVFLNKVLFSKQSEEETE